MEIIRKGELPEEKVWRGECSYCKTVVEAKQKELEVTYDQRDGSYGSAKCPLCKKVMNFYLKSESGNSASYFVK